MRLDEDLHLCKTAVTSGPAVTTTETERTRRGSAGRTKTIEVPATEESTRSCEPIGVVELAVLLVPSLLLIAPALERINIAGLLGVELRRVQERVEAQGRVVTYVYADLLGQRTEEAFTQADKGQVVPLPAED